MANLIGQQRDEQPTVDIDPEVVPVASAGNKDFSVAGQIAPEAQPVPQGPLAPIDFDAVTQPTFTPPAPIVNTAPPVSNDQILEQLGTPNFVVPEFNWDALPNQAELFSGPDRWQLNRSRNYFLPPIQQNPVTAELFPQQSPSEAPGQVRRERGSNFLQRLFFGNSNAQPLPEYGYVNPWRALTEGQFGEYGSGLLGALFYTLDGTTNVARSAVLDLLQHDVALFTTLREGGLRNFGSRYMENLRATDSIPTDDEYVPYVIRALAGDDQSPFNFRSDVDGGYNPLGLLGDNASTFYDEIDTYMQRTDEYVAGAETNLGAAGRRLSSLLSPANPVVRNLPRAIGSLFVDVVTDPSGPLSALSSGLRRVARQEIQTARPLPASVTRFERSLSVELGERQQSQALQSQAVIPMEFGDTPPPAPTGTSAAEIAAQIRFWRRQGLDMPEAIRRVAEDNDNLPVDVNLGELLPQYQWRPVPQITIRPPENATRQQTRALSPQAQWQDVARSTPTSPADFPRPRTSAEITRVVNSQTNIVPEGLQPTEIERIVDALPPIVSDELSLVTRRVGVSVPSDIPVATRSDVPNVLDNVGDELSISQGASLRRTSNSTITLTRSGVVNQDEFIPALRSVLTTTQQRVVYDLPDNVTARNSQVRLFESLGFTQTGNRMIYTPRRRFVDDVVPFRRRRPGNVVELLADNTGRPRGSYTNRVVADFNARLEAKNAAPSPTDEVAQRRAIRVVEVPSTRPMRPVGDVINMPGRAGIRRMRDEALPDVIQIDDIRQRVEANQQGETLEDLFNRADEIMSNPIYDETIDGTLDTPPEVLPPEEIPDFRVVANRQELMELYPNSQETVRLARERGITGTDDEVLARYTGLNGSTNIETLNNSRVVWEESDEVVDIKQTVRDLISPDVTTSPDAYEEVSQTLAYAPIDPDARVLTEVQRYTELRESTASSMQLVNDLQYQLDQVKQIDHEEFYDMVDSSYGQIPIDMDEVSRLLTEESADFQVLWELYEDMLASPSTRSVQRYLSQLEYTVEEQLADAFKLSTREFDLMENQRNVLRELTNESNREYIERIVQEGDVQRINRDRRMGRGHTGPCL